MPHLSWRTSLGLPSQEPIVMEKLHMEILAYTKTGLKNIALHVAVCTNSAPSTWLCHILPLHCHNFRDLIGIVFWQFGELVGNGKSVFAGLNRILLCTFWCWNLVVEGKCLVYILHKQFYIILLLFLFC